MDHIAVGQEVDARIMIGSPNPWHHFQTMLSRIRIMHELVAALKQNLSFLSLRYTGCNTPMQESQLAVCVVKFEGKNIAPK